MPQRLRDCSVCCYGPPEIEAIFDKPSVKVPSPRSKLKLTTGFSLKSHFPTTHPPPPPPGKVSKKQYTAIYPKLKVLVYVRGLWNMFWNKSRAKDYPIWGGFFFIRMWFFGFSLKVLISNSKYQIPKNSSDPISTLKLAQKDWKGPQKQLEIKNSEMTQGKRLKSEKTKTFTKWKLSVYE